MHSVFVTVYFLNLVRWVCMLDWYWREWFCFQDVIRYEMVTSSGQTEKFYLGPFTGLITLRAVLTDTTTTRYQVL